MASKKTAKNKLLLKTESAWKGIGDAERKRIFDFAEGYKIFLGKGKTEREVITLIKRKAEELGFVPLEKAKNLRPGDKIYSINKEKVAALAIVGAEPIESGMNMVTSHTDSPRVDLKQRPIYEDSETDLALFKTHYYGGVKKYQWVVVPLAIHGRVMRADGEAIDVCIGEAEGDPVFMIPDLLPHLARRLQGERKLFDGIKGEEMNVLIGGIPLKGDSKAPFKMMVLDILNKKYGIVEEDLISAELELVPNLKPRDVGFDRSMIGAYGQDDRACVYTSLSAICDLKKPKRTAISLFFDKEEIGSVGSTGAQSAFLEIFVCELDKKTGGSGSYASIKRALSNTRAISGDVDAGMDPSFKDVHEPLNAARMGRGIVISKFGGSGGKGGSSDASAEFVHYVRTIFNKNKIPWQSAELGKVDEGGGGTVARFLASHNMEIVDCGPALLSMHSPFEVSSKIDIYYTYRAYLAFIGA